MAKKAQQDLSGATAAAGGRGKRWIHRHPRWALLLVNLGILSLLLLIGEILLRAWGFHPGALEMGWSQFMALEKGVTLTEHHEYYTDSLGIFKASQAVDQAALGYQVNADGFRGPAFAPDDSSRQKVMLIGDSFTWGATAKPLDSSFADLLRRPDWQVMNFGIPGADPDQYARIATHYIPLMQPDIVCLFFYMANDRMDLPQDVKPFQNRFHLTNVGWLNPFLDGDYLGDAQATYDYCQARYTIPPTTWLNRLCAKTVISTFIWRGMLKLHWIGAHYPPTVQARLDASEALRAQGPFAKQYLQTVKDICLSRNIPFQIFVIPAHNAVQSPTEVEHQQLFPASAEVYYPHELMPEDYHGRPDGHLNNHGHAKMARFVASKIANTLSKQP